MSIEKYVTRKEAAQHLSVGLTKFDELRAEWKIKSYRFGRSVRFKLSEVSAAADKKRAS